MVVESNNTCNSGPVPVVVVSGHKLSTVVPASVTGEVTHDLTNMDLVMKLHYLRGVYYFKKSDVLESLTTFKMKEPMFPLLDVYYQVSGRIRVPEEPSGSRSRPYVKCNDCGVRIVEAACSVTLEEWLSDSKEALSRTQQLVPGKVLGPNLFYSPLTYVQFTKFSCGGLAIGCSWSHVIGDAKAAVGCFNKWAELLQDMKKAAKTGISKPNPPNKIETNNSKNSLASDDQAVPISVKEVEPVGDVWVLPSSSQMVNYSFQMRDEKIKQLLSEDGLPVGDFETISALLWKTIAKVREGKEVSKITVCKNNLTRSNKILANEQTISSVEIDSSPSKLDISELAMAISKHANNETQKVEAFVNGENGTFKDVIVYGANLTFVDMLDLDLYGFTLRGQRPVNVEYAVDGVGEEGSVLVMQGNDKNAKLVVLVLPENELLKVKQMLDISVM